MPHVMETVSKLGRTQTPVSALCGTMLILATILTVATPGAIAECSTSLKEIFQQDETLALLVQLLEVTEVPDIPAFLTFQEDTEPPAGITILALTNDAINTSFQKNRINAFSESFKLAFQNVLAFTTLLDKAYTHRDFTKTYGTCCRRYRTAFNSLPIKVERIRIAEDGDEFDIRAITPFGTANMIHQNSTNSELATSCIKINDIDIPVSIFFIDNFLLPFECRNEVVAKESSSSSRGRYRGSYGYQRYQQNNPVELDLAKCMNEASDKGFLDPTKAPFLYRSGIAKWINGN